MTKLKLNNHNLEITKSDKINDFFTIDVYHFEGDWQTRLEIFGDELEKLLFIIKNLS